MQQPIWGKALLILCFSILTSIGMLSNSASAASGDPCQGPQAMSGGGNPVPVKYPGDGQSYQMTNSNGKKYDFDPTFENSQGNVGGFYSNAHDLKGVSYLYVLNPDTKEYGVLWGDMPWSYLEFYENPYGPGYTWHRINSNGTVIEKGELRLN